MLRIVNQDSRRSVRAILCTKGESQCSSAALPRPLGPIDNHRSSPTPTQCCLSPPHTRVTCCRQPSVQDPPPRCYMLHVNTLLVSAQRGFEPCVPIAAAAAAGCRLRARYRRRRMTFQRLPRGSRRRIAPDSASGGAPLTARSADGKRARRRTALLYRPAKSFRQGFHHLPAGSALQLLPPSSSAVSQPAARGAPGAEPRISGGRKSGRAMIASSRSDADLLRTRG